MRQPSFKISLEEATIKFNLPDLSPALHHFLQRLDQGGDTLLSIGSRCSPVSDPIPFNQVAIWPNLVLQVKEYHHCDNVLMPEKLHASPPTEEWPVGRCDVAFANTDAHSQWPQSGLSGILSVQCPVYYGPISGV